MNLKMLFLDGGGYRRAMVRTRGDDQSCAKEWTLCWIPVDWSRLGSFSVEWFDGTGKHFIESVSTKMLASVQVYD